MASFKRIFRTILNVNQIIVDDFKITYEIRRGLAKAPVLNVYVRPMKSQRERCPVCGKKRPIYDTRPIMRCWRAPDFNGVKVLLWYCPCRVSCPEHGVHQEKLPWTITDNYSYTRDFILLAALIAMKETRASAAIRLRTSWQTASNCVSLALKILEPDLTDRYNDLVNIGIDETSYKKGHKYITTVVNHETNTVVWMHDGHDVETLSLFFEALTQKQRENIGTVSGDAAPWIRVCMKKYIPHATFCLDKFHVSQWFVSALDEVRRTEWRAMKDEIRTVNKALRELPEDASDEKAKLGEALKKAKEKASTMKNARYAICKNPDNLTPNQKLMLQHVVETDSKVTEARNLKEQLRMGLSLTEEKEARSVVEDFIQKASQSGLEPFRKLSRSIREHLDDLMNTIRSGLSNAAIEANNNKIKLLLRKAFGFRKLKNLTSVVMLGCSRLRITLPNRGGLAISPF